MVRIQLLIVLRLIAATSLGCAAVASSQKLQEAGPRERRIQVDGLAYLVLPPGYDARFSQMWDDARTGCFLPTEAGPLRPTIYFAAGVVTRLQSASSSSLEWVRRDGLEYALTEDRVLLVNLGTVHLSAPVENEQALQLVLSVARSYRWLGARCRDCDDVKAVGGRRVGSSTVFDGCPDAGRSGL
jgi:hypothetical protein